MELGYNTRCPAVKRLLREAQELHKPTEEYFAQPLEDNLFEWHFTLRGPVNTEFEEGIYHGRIILPSEYPMKPPDIIFITQNGRFETNKKICLSISGYHPESWRPSWSIRTALLAIIGYMPSSGLGTIAGLQYSPAERRILAKKSWSQDCEVCGQISTVLLPRTSLNAQQISQEAQQISREMTVTEKPLASSADSEVQRTQEECQPVQDSADTNGKPVSESSSTSAASISPVTSNAEPTTTDAFTFPSPEAATKAVFLETAKETVINDCVTTPPDSTLTVPNSCASSTDSVSNVSSNHITSSPESSFNSPSLLNQRCNASARVSSEENSVSGAGVVPPSTVRLPRPSQPPPPVASEALINRTVSCLLVLCIALLTALVMRRVLIATSTAHENDELFVFDVDHEEFYPNT
ncbi:ubiquitin-conjugating enzyme E2 J1 [Hyalella azteca]|uniref:Ubiquitin-conjugating enzyme E2 J1 n=1 Tax=Hyalella azteca TaxID=294128 RepID=A0A8B7PD97_HYAAZ|nr:ubiquitin-conjugating enzyme E2 J1 [Hyalella azteca]